MFDILDWVLIGSSAANTVANVVEGVVINKHSKQFKELEGSANTAAAAYNAAKEAEMTAAKANQHCDWLHAELDKQKILPEKPKSDSEITAEFMKSLTTYMKAATPEQPKAAESITDKQTKVITDAVVAAIASGFNNLGK